MPATPTEWNAIAVGAWNRAILTPNGIGRRLFQIEEGIPIEVQVAIDKPGVYRVSHQGLIVSPSIDRLVIDTAQPDEDSLKRAAELCVRAIESLPETPLSAVGINIRYVFDEIPNDLIDKTAAPLDTALSDDGRLITESSISRSIEFKPGVVNLKVSKLNDGSGKIEFNFHMSSSSIQELVGWLKRTPEFLKESDRLAAVLGEQNVRHEINA